MYRGSCLFHDSRSSGVSGCGAESQGPGQAGVVMAGGSQQVQGPRRAQAAAPGGLQAGCDRLMPPVEVQLPSRTGSNQI